MIPKSGGEKVEMIRLLKCATDSATESRTRAINQIKAILVTAPSLLRERLEPLRRQTPWSSRAVHMAHAKADAGR